MLKKITSLPPREAGTGWHPRSCPTTSSKSIAKLFNGYKNKGFYVHIGYMIRQLNLAGDHPLKHLTTPLIFLFLFYLSFHTHTRTVVTCPAYSNVIWTLWMNLAQKLVTPQSNNSSSPLNIVEIFIRWHHLIFRLMALNLKPSTQDMIQTSIK